MYVLFCSKLLYGWFIKYAQKSADCSSPFNITKRNLFHGNICSIRRENRKRGVYRVVCYYHMCSVKNILLFWFCLSFNFVRAYNVMLLLTCHCGTIEFSFKDLQIYLFPLQSDYWVVFTKITNVEGILLKRFSEIFFSNEDKPNQKYQ